VGRDMGLGPGRLQGIQVTAGLRLHSCRCWSAAQVLALMGSGFVERRNAGERSGVDVLCAPYGLD
jgi:hypothetical protein